MKAQVRTEPGGRALDTSGMAENAARLQLQRILGRGEFPPSFAPAIFMPDRFHRDALPRPVTASPKTIRRREAKPFLCSGREPILFRLQESLYTLRTLLINGRKILWI